MAVKVLIILFSIWICLETVSSESVIHACYGTDPTCDHYSIECPANHTIQLGNLRAGYKSNSDCQLATHCSINETCCVYADADRTETFNVKNAYDTYSNCSGKPNCSQVHAPWQLMSSTPNVPTTYVQVGYSCVPEERSFSMCETGSRSGNIVDIFYEGSKDMYNSSNPGKTCQCIMKTVGQSQTFDMTVVDIRMERFYRNIVGNVSVAHCSSALLTSSFSIQKDCTNTTNNLHYEQNFVYKHISHDIPLIQGRRHSLTLAQLFAQGEQDAPAMVWISVQASNNRQVIVNCTEGVFPEETTTTTTTTQATSSTYRDKQPYQIIVIMMYCVFIYCL